MTPSVPAGRRSARIAGTGSFVPARVLTNEEIEATVPGASAAWTAERLGIRERRVAAPGESTGDLAFEAGRRAVEAAGLQPGDIDLIIVATTTPHRIAPSTACYVQHRLGDITCAAFDLGAVCSGFIYGLSVASQFIAAGVHRNVLLIGADTFSKITDWTRRDCVFFGDGAGAVVLSACPPGEGLLGADLGASGSGTSAWTVPAGGSQSPTSAETLERREHYWTMEGKAVYEMALERIPATLDRSLAAAGLMIDDIDHVVPHQPSIAILQDSAKVMGIPFAKFHTNMATFANTSAATIPLLLDGVHRDGGIARGDIVALVAVGAGWTWGSAVLRWELGG